MKALVETPGLLNIRQRLPSQEISRAYHTVVVPKNNKPANIADVQAQAAAAKAFAEANGAPPPTYFVIGDGPIIGPKQ